MTEAEKRERRALERKLSEMEEELKVSIDFSRLLSHSLSPRGALPRRARAVARSVIVAHHAVPQSSFPIATSVLIERY